MSESLRAAEIERGEIDLVDIALVFFRHKVLFFVIFISCLLLAGLYAMNQPVRYKYQVSLKVGGYWVGTGNAYSGRFELFETTESVVAKIKHSYGPQVLREASYDPEQIPDKFQATTEKGSSLVNIEIELLEEHEDVAKALLEQVAGKVIDDHNGILAERKELREKFLADRIAELNDEIMAMKESRSAVAQDSTGDSKALAMLMTDSFMQRLESERSQLVEELSVGLQANLEPTKMIYPPSRGMKPVTPGVTMVVLIGAFIGIFLGTALIMLRELLDAVRIRNQSSKV